MKKIIVFIAIIAILVLGSYFMFFKDGSLVTPLPSFTPQADNMIRITAPKPNDLVKSPIHIEGEARGNWYFEASFPVRIIDADGKELGIMPVQAQGSWMTTEFVPFKADLDFSEPVTETGTLILEKDNPSGLSENADERRIPIRFK